MLDFERQMNIKIIKKIDKNSVPVFVLYEGTVVEKHPFFRQLAEGDRRYLTTFQAKFPLKDGHTHILVLPSGERAVLMGVSQRQKFTHRKALLTARKIVAVVRRERIKNPAVHFEDFMAARSGMNARESAEVLATQFEMANFEFVVYKTVPSEGWFFVENLFVYASKNIPAITDGLKRGKVIGEEINGTRILSNTPGGDMTPQKLAEAAMKAGKESGFSVKVLGEEEIKKLGMGGVLGVSKGSVERPRFIVMEYLKGKKSEKPVVLVGKGVTFDTGGLNLKPENGIYEMHMDMTGGAAVIHIMAALARLKEKKNIIGLVPAVENMPSGSSYHPGDMLKTMSGKTIEVLNTDAEGRIILADGLEYAKKYNPRLVIDVATLTGAAMSALGQRASAIFTTSPKLETKLREVGEKTGDFVWPLPLWEEYEEEVKGTFGDVANLGKTRYGGAITGAVFLWQFIKGYPWVHIDIAPRMTSIEGEFLAKGSAGPSVNLLVHFLRDF